MIFNLEIRKRYTVLLFSLKIFLNSKNLPILGEIRQVKDFGWLVLEHLMLSVPLTRLIFDQDPHLTRIRLFGRVPPVS